MLELYFLSTADFLFLYILEIIRFIFYLRRTFCFSTSWKLSVITAPAVDPSLIPACNPTHERLHKYCAGSSVPSPGKKKTRLISVLEGNHLKYM